MVVFLKSTALSAQSLKNRIGRNHTALRYFPWFLIKLPVCDAVAFFASIEVCRYYPVISTTKNIASSLYHKYRDLSTTGKLGEPIIL